jgi:hypothetical protein
MTKARDIASATPAPSTVSSAELGYLDGVTSAIQTQVDAKIAKTLTTTTGDTIYASSANTPARLGIGSTGNVLTVAGGVPTWAAPAGGGKLLQVVGATYSTQTASTSTSLVDTGLTATITPSATSSKILVIFNMPFMRNNTNNDTDSQSMLSIIRGSTNLTGEIAIEHYQVANGSQLKNPISWSWLDSPSTTSATTYKVQMKSNQTNITSTAQVGSIASNIILMEIGA